MTDQLSNDLVSKIKRVSAIIKTKKQFVHWVKLLNSIICTIRKIIKNKVPGVNYLKIESNLAHLKFYSDKFRNLKDRKTIRRNRNTKWEHLESCFEGRVCSGLIVNYNSVDPELFLKKAFTCFSNQIKKALQRSLLKINVILYYNFIKPQTAETDIKYFNTKNEIIDNTKLKIWYDEHVIDKILQKLEEFQERDSGWALFEILHLKVNINNYSPISYGTSTYRELPQFIKKTKAVINIKNDDVYCFLWSIVAAKFPCRTNQNVSRTSSYPHFSEILKYDGIRFPIRLKDIPKFEFMNNISINTYTISSDCKRKEVVLEVVEVVEIFHFALIKNLHRLLYNQISKSKNKKYLCERCLNH